jgi:opine dehydrogenase
VSGPSSASTSAARSTKETVAVLGGGHGAHAMAADLAARGFSVNMFEMPQFRDRLRELFDTRTIAASGVIHGTFKLNKVTSDVDDAIADARHILVVTPAFAHEEYARLLKGRVTRDQIIVVYPGAFAGLLFRSVFGDTDCPVVAEVNNLPYDARLIAPCRIAIHGRNRVNVAFLPAARGAELIDDLRQIHPYERVYSDVLEAGLSIVNPGVHAGPCLLSITAIENSPKHPFFLYEHGVTPGSCRLNLQIDYERKAIGRKLGYTLTPIEDFTGLDEGYSWQDLYMRIHGNIALTPISGPHDLTSRYFTEDAPYGLVPWSHIGKAVGVATPVIDSIVNIYSVVHERDWWIEGRTVDDLGLDGMSVEQIKAYVKTGSISNDQEFRAVRFREGTAPPPRSPGH